MSACASRWRFRASGVEGAGMARSSVDELLARSRGSVRVVEVEVSADALTSLPTQLTRALAPRGGFPGDGGSKQPHRMVLLRELGFELARLSQLRVDVSSPSAVRREERLAPHPGVVQFLGRGNLSVASFCHVRGVCLVVGDHDAALPRGVIAPSAGVVGVAEPLVCDV
jgi:hypothetical protein